MLRSQALETPQLGFREWNGRKSCWTWPGSAPKPPRPSLEPSPKPFPEPCWTWPGSAPKPPGTFLGTFSGTLLNLYNYITWLCTKASQTFSGTLLNLTWLCTKAGTFSGTFSGTLLNPCLEPCWTWPGSAPKSPRPPPKPCPEPCWTWPGSAPKPPRPSLEPSPKPSPEPCWTWPGSAPKPPECPEPYLVEFDPAPAPVNTGAILGWRPQKLTLFRKNTKLTYRFKMQPNSWALSCTEIVFVF